MRLLMNAMAQIGRFEVWSEDFIRGSFLFYFFTLFHILLFVPKIHPLKWIGLLVFFFNSPALRGPWGETAGASSSWPEYVPGSFDKNTSLHTYTTLTPQRWDGAAILSYHSRLVFHMIYCEYIYSIGYVPGLRLRLIRKSSELLLLHSQPYSDRMSFFLLLKAIGLFWGIKASVCFFFLLPVV